MTTITFVFILLLYVDQYNYTKELINSKDSDYYIHKEGGVGTMIGTTTKDNELIATLNDQNISALYYDINNSILLYDSSEMKEKFGEYSRSENTLNNPNYSDKPEIFFNSMYSNISLTNQIMSVEYAKANDIFYSVDYIEVDQQNNDKLISLLESSDIDYSNDATLRYEYDPIVQMYRLKKTLLTYSLLMLILVIFIIVGYLKLENYRYNIYELFGLNDFQIVKRSFLELFGKILIPFVFAMIINIIIVYLNGKMFYLQNFYEITYLNTYVITLGVILLICFCYSITIIIYKSNNKLIERLK